MVGNVLSLILIVFFLINAWLSYGATASKLTLTLYGDLTRGGSNSYEVNEKQDYIDPVCVPLLQSSEQKQNDDYGDDYGQERELRAAGNVVAVPPRVHRQSLSCFDAGTEGKDGYDIFYQEVQCL